MIKRFVERFTAAEPSLRAALAVKHPDSYDDLFARVVNVLSGDDTDYDAPDPERITVIDHGDYQGSRVFIVGAKGYQPSLYWGVVVSYGSCSGCDTFQAISGYSDDAPDASQVGQYLDLMRHMVQGLRAIHSDTWEPTASVSPPPMPPAAP
jgi:hypothetical protein